MQILKPNSDNLNQAVRYLQRGGVLIHPTDTCYGIAADIKNKKAVEKIYALKKMSFQKPMSILVPDLEMLKEYGEVSNEVEKIIQKYLPGPLTILLPRKNSVPPFYAQNLDLIGVRNPKHSLSLEIARALGSPITTTSANITGQVQAYSPDEVKEYFKNEDVLFLDGGDLEKKKPSTIIKIVNGYIEIIRQGDLVMLDFSENLT